HSSQLAHQAAAAYAAAQAKEAERVAEHIQRVEARGFACAADAEAAISDYEGRGQGRRGRTPRLWRSHVLHYHVEAVSTPKKRTRRGRPPKAEAPQVEVRYRLRVHPEALLPSEDAHGWTVLATTLRSEACTDVEMLQAYQEQHITVEPGFRWIKNPAAITPVWLEKPARIAALAMPNVPSGWPNWSNGSHSGFCCRQECLSSNSSPKNTSATMRPPTAPSWIGVVSSSNACCASANM